METVTVFDLQGNPLPFLERVKVGERLLVVHQDRAMAELRPVEQPVGGTTPEDGDHFQAELTETYRAQIDSALAAGWNDPAMDDYNDYDAH